jgi:hypothetical protein
MGNPSDITIVADTIRDKCVAKHCKQKLEGKILESIVLLQESYILSKSYL